MTKESFFSKISPYLLSILRIIVGFLFIQHGMQKLFGFPVDPTTDVRVAFFSQMGLAGCLEFFGGFLIIIGLFTRITAFILSGEMAFAYFMVHYPQGFWTVLNKGELAVLYCFFFLYLSVVGGGPLSVDHFRRKGLLMESETSWDE